MPKAKEEEKGKKAPVEELGPYSDPEILHKYYVKECAAIGIEAYSPVKDALTNVDNPNRGKQILMLQQSKDDGNCLGSDGCIALVNAIIAQPFTAAKDIRISSNIKDSGATALGKLLATTAKKPSIQPSDPSAAQPLWQIEYLELINNDIGLDGALVGRRLANSHYIVGGHCHCIPCFFLFCTNSSHAFSGPGSPEVGSYGDGDCISGFFFFCTNSSHVFSGPGSPEVGDSRGRVPAPPS